MSDGPPGASEVGLCRCGCGEATAKAFIPGHDQRAIHARIRKVGTVAEFLDWFDAHFEDQPQQER